ncbi:MAG TPA: NUDIX hydrolase [Chloroflexota bacterium]|nr:NUDIX hydrolase [Chloroflexota bacterium]
MAKLKTARAESEGGVVYRQRDGEIEVVLVGREAQGSWFLPKGTPLRGESREQTAIREVSEETGLEVRILEPITSISYWFMSGRVRIFKTVYYYLMVPTGGDISRHDPEYDRVAWFPIQQALAVLTYANDADVVRRAAELIKRRLSLQSQQATRR